MLLGTPSDTDVEQWDVRPADEASEDGWRAQSEHGMSPITEEGSRDPWLTNDPWSQGRKLSVGQGHHSGSLDGDDSERAERVAHGWDRWSTPRHWETNHMLRNENYENRSNAEWGDWSSESYDRNSNWSRRSDQRYCHRISDYDRSDYMLTYDNAQV